MRQQFVTPGRGRGALIIRVFVASLMTTLMLVNSGALSQKSQDLFSPRPLAGQATDQRIDGVWLSVEDLTRYAKIEAQLYKLQKSYDQGAPDVQVNGSPVRKLLQQTAQRVDRSIRDAIFCSTANSTIESTLVLRLRGKVRDQGDVERVRAIIDADPVTSALRSAGLIEISIEADGGQSGGCIVEVGPGVTVTKKSKDAFMFMSHAEMVRQKEMLRFIPDKKMCGDIGRMIMKLREDGARVPERQKVLFNTFWVRDGDQLTLCREDGDDWRSAPTYRVKPGWEGLLVSSKGGSN